MYWFSFVSVIKKIWREASFVNERILFDWQFGNWKSRQHNANFSKCLMTKNRSLNKRKRSHHQMEPTKAGVTQSLSGPSPQLPKSQILKDHQLPMLPQSYNIWTFRRNTFKPFSSHKERYDWDFTWEMNNEGLQL